MVRQAVPLQPMEDDGEQRFYLQPMEDPTPEQMETSEADCDPMGSPCWSRLLAGPLDPVGDPHWSSLLLKDCILQKEHTLEQFVENCNPWEGLTLEKSMEDCLPWEGPHTGAGAECEESSP
ncbi:hypothetical protein GRJ2_000439300 [Grus japonensis]|uniref:Uncharacterized protein n=1 Tax=Grus japonensis TaxID=30415 RepID=A0ABC9W2A4_GRUJA